MGGLIGRYIGKDFFDYTSLVTYTYLKLVFLVFCFCTGGSALRYLVEECLYYTR